MIQPLQKRAAFSVRLSVETRSAAQAVLQLSERVKIGLLVPLLLKGAKELRRVPKFLQRDPQLVALPG